MKQLDADSAEEKAEYDKILEGLKSTLPFAYNWRMLWHCNYYDGALSGVGLWQGKKCWFNCVHYGGWLSYEHEEDIAPELSDCLPRLYVVYELPLFGRILENTTHFLFRWLVGTYSDYGEAGNRTGKCKPTWRIFFELNKLFPDPDYTKGEKIAYFER